MHGAFITTKLSTEAQISAYKMHSPSKGSRILNIFSLPSKGNSQLLIPIGRAITFSFGTTVIRSDQHASLNNSDRGSTIAFKEHG